jgi:hypothetical protein
MFRGGQWAGHEVWLLSNVDLFMPMWRKVGCLEKYLMRYSKQIAPHETLNTCPRRALGEINAQIPERIMRITGEEVLHLRKRGMRMDAMPAAMPAGS